MSRFSPGKRFIYRDYSSRLIIEIDSKSFCCGAEYNCLVKYQAEGKHYIVNKISKIHLWDEFITDLRNQDAPAPYFLIRD